VNVLRDALATRDVCDARVKLGRTLRLSERWRRVNLCVKHDGGRSCDGCWMGPEPDRGRASLGGTVEGWHDMTVGGAKYGARVCADARTHTMRLPVIGGWECVQSCTVSGDVRMQTTVQGALTGAGRGALGPGGVSMHLSSQQGNSWWVSQASIVHQPGLPHPRDIGYNCTSSQYSD
jgi:hypothetical protein